MTIWCFDPIEYDFDKDVDTSNYGYIGLDSSGDHQDSADFCLAVDTDLFCIDGNAALLDMDAEAVGCDTYVHVDSNVLAVEDELSSVTLQALAAVA